MRHLLAICILLVGLVLDCTAEADDTETRDALARLFWGEAGPDRARDHAGLYHVLLVRQDVRGDERLLDTIHAYSSGVLRDPQTPRQRWIAGLESDCTEPDGWPAHLDWHARYEPACKRVFTRAQRFLVDLPPNPCPEARLWGGRGIDHPRGRMEPVCVRRGLLLRYYAVR